MEYWFYHLEQTSLESALPNLLEKTLEKGWRARVQLTDAARMAALDEYLWTYRDDSFLPHGRDDEPGAIDHPIILSAKPSTVTEDIVFLVHGAEPGPLGDAKRCITMVDSRDERSVTIARERWKTAKAQNASVSYWKQNDHGKWQKNQ